MEIELTRDAIKLPKIKQKLSEKPKVTLDFPNEKTKDELIAEISAKKEDGILGFVTEGLVANERRKKKEQETKKDEHTEIENKENLTSWKLLFIIHALKYVVLFESSFQYIKIELS